MDVAHRHGALPRHQQRDYIDETPDTRPIPKDESAGWTADEDTRFWLDTIGPFLRNLLKRLHYGAEQRRTTEFFAREIVAPSLGPHPDEFGQPAQWKSFMTDDFTPIEFGWTWSEKNRSASRKVRFSIEPIGHAAGSANDPWNTTATLSLLNRLDQNMQQFDLRWFNELSELLLPTRSSPGSYKQSKEVSSPSTLFLAFEFGQLEPIVKAYLISGPKAAATGQSDETIIYGSLSTFAKRNHWMNLELLLDSLQTRGTALGLIPFMIAVDCIDPLQSRLKIYLRSPETSFQSIAQVMTTFDKAGSTERGLNELRDLYAALFGLDTSTFDHSKPLPTKSHQTAGMLYYIEVHPFSTQRTVKVYLPVKHYGKNDLQVAIALTTFMKSREPSKSKTCDNFVTALKRGCSHRPLESDVGMQTYVSCAIRDSSLDITSYLNPEIYHPGRVANAVPRTSSSTPKAVVTD